MVQWRRQNGLSLLEFTLAVLIVAVLTLLAFERIGAVRAEMERVRVQHTVAAMRSALALQFADLVVNDRLDQLNRYEGLNALELLAPPPANYRGERAKPVADVAPGNWYYVRESAAVAYRPRNPLAFGNADERLYWRVVGERDSGTRAGYDGASGNGLALVRSAASGRPLPAQERQQQSEQQAESQQ